jgi:hypothetical protein
MFGPTTGDRAALGAIASVKVEKTSPIGEEYEVSTTTGKSSGSVIEAFSYIAEKM